MSRVRIVLVEDNAADAELTLKALRQRDLADAVVVCRDGVEAVDYLLGEDAGSRELPKLVLLDLKLPKLDGIEVLQRLKTDARTHDVPVVVLTSSAEPCDLADCYRLGANSFIVKPVTFEDFARAVGEVGVYWTELNRTPNQEPLPRAPRPGAGSP